jgi:hypothetical protein
MIPRILLLAPLAALAACRGSGLYDGNGSEATALNAVHRSYARPADEVWRAVTSTVQELGLEVERNQHDALGGEIAAQRANKDRVTIEARSLDAQNTRLAVAVAPGDRNLAEMIQDRIAQKLGLGVPRAGLSAGSVVEGTYDAELEACVQAAQRAVEALKMGVARKDVHDTWAQVDSLQADAIPVRVRMERTRDDQTRVFFEAGTSRSEDTRLLADRLKVQFERALPR